MLFKMYISIYTLFLIYIFSFACLCGSLYNGESIYTQISSNWECQYLCCEYINQWNIVEKDIFFNNSISNDVSHYQFVLWSQLLLPSALQVDKQISSYLNVNRSSVKILYMSVILYGPSLALSQVTGLNIWLAVGSCGLICTIYTSIVSL